MGMVYPTTSAPILKPYSHDFFPISTDSKILQEFITQESHKLDIAPRPPMAVTNAVSWRSEGIKYRKNEVFLDVIGQLRFSMGCGSVDAGQETHWSRVYKQYLD